ncbi:hypothetical protein ABZ419_28260 [Streptomyces cinnamoneus]|uniref:hypothetical protein n=1 Tax=Streptomyces cinnamoneus TaxID=53446 RepID=UPI0033EF5834
MNSTQSRRRGVARLMAVCALLFGLFLMHGAPATAAGGCHESVSAPVSLHDEHADHGGQVAAAMTAAAVAGSAHVAPQMVIGEHGSSCVATPERDRILLPTVWLLVAVLAGLSAWAMARRRVAAGSVGRRGPPGGGRALLLRVCVART